VNNAGEVKPPGSCEHSVASFENAGSADFPEGSRAGASLDRAGNALGKEEPPWDEVAIPRVDNDNNVGLVEQVADADLELGHWGLRLSGIA
jgi:hypothetical protein